MIIRLAPSGSVSCEISDFRIVVNPGTRERGNLTLNTKTDLPIVEKPENTINRAGEYEISGIKINGFTMPGNTDDKIMKTAYVVGADGINICFLDDMVNDLDDKMTEKFGTVDILVLYADKKSVESKKMAALVKEMEPRIVLAMNEDAADGLSEGLGKKPEIMDRLVIKRKDLDNDETDKFIWIKEK